MVQKKKSKNSSEIYNHCKNDFTISQCIRTTLKAMEFYAINTKLDNFTLKDVKPPANSVSGDEHVIAFCSDDWYTRNC